MNKESNPQIEIDIVEILLILRSKLWIILITLVLAFAGIICYCTFTFVPQYSSTATVFILRPQEDADGNVNTQDIAIANSIMSDCTVIAKSREVLSKVADAYPNYELRVSQMRSRISVFNQNNTHIIEITYRGNTPEESKDVVNAIVAEFQEKIKVILNTELIGTIDEGETGVQCNAKYPLSRFAIAIILIIVECAAFIAVALFDNKIKEQEDVERFLGLTVLGDIPPLGDGSGQTYGRYTSYGKYGKYGKYGYGKYGKYGYGKYGKYGQYGKYGGDTKTDSTEATVKEESK